MKKISNGKNLNISNSSLPNMSQTIVGWFQPITFGLITYSLVDFENQETVTYIDTQGVVQPYRPEPLEIQAAGDVSWSWLQVHCLPDLILKNGSYVYYNGVKYKVLSKSDYRAYGYVEYMLTETFEGN